MPLVVVLGKVYQRRQTDDRGVVKNFSILPNKVEELSNAFEIYWL